MQQVLLAFPKRSNVDIGKEVYVVENSNCQLTTKNKATQHCVQCGKFVTRDWMFSKCCNATKKWGSSTVLQQPIGRVCKIEDDEHVWVGLYGNSIY